MRDLIPGPVLTDGKGKRLGLTQKPDKANCIFRIELFPGDYVTISASRYPFANVMPPGRRSEDWVNSISRTLQWNSRQRQKAFHEWDEGGKDKKIARRDQQKRDQVAEETKQDYFGAAAQDEAGVWQDNNNGN